MARLTLPGRQPAEAPRGAHQMREGRRSRRPSSAWLLALGALVLAGSTGRVHAQVAPPHLDILTAQIREVPPLDPFDVGSRVVSIELTLAGAPTCTGSSPSMAYGVLIDSDLDPLTGTTHAAFDPLGVDARISADCDQSAGQFVSEAGAVDLGSPGPGGEVQLTITTTVSSLPAVAFDWIAFAIEGASFTRLPASPELAGWTIYEKVIP